MRQKMQYSEDIDKESGSDYTRLGTEVGMMGKERRVKGKRKATKGSDQSHLRLAMIFEPPRKAKIQTQ